MRPKPLTCSISALLLVAQLPAATIIFDDFGAPGSAIAQLNGRTPDTGPADWEAYSEGPNVGWKTEDGAAYLGSSSQNGMGGIVIGTDYFANNPGVYSLESTFEITGADGWYGIGFTEGLSTSGNRGLYQSSVSNEGTPWMFARGSGEVVFRHQGGSSGEVSDTGNDVSDITIRLELDTTVTSWTVAAYINDEQMDLGGTNMLYTYPSNPDDIGAVALSAASTVVGTVETFSLSTIPEPSTYALILGAAALGVLLLRRRR